MLALLKSRLPDLTLGFIFFALIAKRPEPYFSYIIGVFVLFLIYDIYRCYKSNDPYVLRQKEILIIIGGIIAFYGALILDGILLGNTKGIKIAFDYMYFSVPFFLVWWIRRKYTADTGIPWGIAIGIITSCIIGIWNIHIRYIPITDRLYGTHFHPNVFATVLTTTIPMTVYFTMKSKCLKAKVFLSLCTIVQFVALYFTFSRGAFLSLIIGLPLAVFITALITMEKVSAKVKKGMAGLLILVLVFVGSALFLRQESLTAGGKMGGERIQMRIASVEMWKDHKLLGVGLGNWFDNYYGKYKPKGIRELDQKHPHNMSVYFLATTGLLGLIGYYAFIISVLSAVIMMGRRGDPLLCIAVLCAVLAFYIHGWLDQTIISKSLGRIYFAVLGYYMAAMADYAEKIKNKIHPDKD